MNIQLLLIDPQKDFCDPNGSLSVPGGVKDMDNVAKLIKDKGKKLDDIHITLDSHHLFDIAHPIYWRDSSGNNPTPFTIINPEDMENGTWTTTVPGLFNRTLQYLKDLKMSARYALCVWPPHCLISSEGHNLMPNVLDAIHEWEKAPGIADMITKGSNPYSEHYSCVMAEVPDPEDPSTQLNTNLIKTLTEADIVLIAGEASSHCVAASVRDIANNFGDDSYISKLHFLKDCSSPVPSFENLEDEFIKEMVARGMKVCNSTDLPI